MPISFEDYQAQFGGLAGSPVGQGPRREYGWGDRFGASVDAAQAGLLGVAEAAGIDSVAGLRRENQFDGDYVRQRAIEDTGAPTGLADTFSSPGKFVKGVAGLAIDSAPQLGASLAAGAIGGPVLGMSTLGRLGLGAAAGAPFNLGDILQNQRDEAGRTDLGSAIPLTVPYTAFDMLGLDAALSSGKMMKSGMRALDEMKGIKGGLARAAVNTGINAFAEGTGETGQEFMNQFGRMSVNPNQTVFNPEANDRYIESFGGGALLGGGISAPLGSWRRSGKAPPPSGMELQSGGSVDLVAPPTQPSDPPLQLGFNPLAGTPIVFPDGSVTLNSEQELQARYPNSVPPVTGQNTAADGRASNPLVFNADAAGTTATNYDDTQALQDPGAELARQRFLEQRAKQQAEQAVAAEQRQAAEQAAKARTELTQRAGNVGLDAKKGAHVNLMGALEKARDAGLIDNAELGKLAGEIAGGATPANVLGKLKTIDEASKLEAAKEVAAGTAIAVKEAVMSGMDGKAELRDAQKLAAAEKAQAEVKAANPAPPPAKPANVKVVQPKAPATNAGTATTSQAPAVTTAAAPVSGTVAANATAVQPTTVSQPAAPAVEPKKPRVVKGLTASLSGVAGAKTEVVADTAPVVQKTLKEQAAADLSDSAARLKAFLKKGPTDKDTVHLGAGPTVHPELHAILVDMVGAAMRLGYHSIKDAVAHVRKTLEDVLGKEEADKITDGHIKAARAEAGLFKPKHKAVVNGYVDLDLLRSALEGREDLERAVRYYLLIDDDGTHIPADEVASLGAAAKRAKLGSSDHAQLSKINKALGITEAVADRIQISHYASAPLGQPSSEVVRDSEYDGELVGKKRSTVSLGDKTWKKVSKADELAQQQAYKDGPTLTDEDPDDYGDGELEYDAGLSIQKSGGHASIEGFDLSPFDSVKVRAYRDIKGKELGDVKTPALVHALQVAIGHITPDKLPANTSKQLLNTAERNLAMQLQLRAELDRRIAAGLVTSADNAAARRKMQASGDMLRTKPETAREQAAREKREAAAQAAIEKDEAESVKRNNRGEALTADGTDYRTVSGGTVSNPDGLFGDVQPTQEGKTGRKSGRKDSVDGDNAAGTEAGSGLVAKGTVTIRGSDGNQLVLPDPGRALKIQGDKLDRLKALLNCFAGG